MWRRQLLSALAILAVASLPNGASAQATYRPYSSPFSPWLGLYQKNSGPLDPYHTIVQPQMQLRNTLQRQAGEIQLNTTAISTTGQELTQMQEQGPVEPTGTGSVFMQYSHYFQSGSNGYSPGIGAAGRRPGGMSRAATYQAGRTGYSLPSRASLTGPANVR
jgi:hypothetical protein